MTAAKIDPLLTVKGYKLKLFTSLTNCAVAHRMGTVAYQSHPQIALIICSPLHCVSRSQSKMDRIHLWQCVTIAPTIDING